MGKSSSVSEGSCCSRVKVVVEESGDVSKRDLLGFSLTTLLLVVVLERWSRVRKNWDLPLIIGGVINRWDILLVALVGNGCGSGFHC